MIIIVTAIITFIGTSVLLYNYYFKTGHGLLKTLENAKTNNLENYTRNADILISAVGKKGLITSDMVKDNSVIIDVGITRDIETKKIYGDVDFDDVYDKVSKITPVPGGVGVMTVTSLLQNVLKCYKLQK